MSVEMLNSLFGVLGVFLDVGTHIFIVVVGCLIYDKYFKIRIED